MNPGSVFISRYLKGRQCGYKMETVVMLLLPLLAQAVAGAVVVVQEVPVGTTVELPCPSSDDAHRFQFWLLLDKEVLGPGNIIDPTKYKYDVLTGHLHIKSISSTESGTYTCVSKALESDSSFNTKSIEVIVRKDWEELYETDPATNLMRGLIAMGVLLIILIVGIVIYMLRRARVIHIRDMSDEESPDEVPGTYNVPNMPTMSSNSAPTNLGVDNPSLETDFPHVFRSMQQTNDSQI